jgi:hypothetical protein
MDTKAKETLKSLLCGLGYEDRHFLDRPVTLNCGHSACQSCLQNLKNNTGLLEMPCKLCNKLNRLDIEFCESVFAQSLIQLNINNIGVSLKKTYQENFAKLKSIFKLAYFKLNFYV